MSRYDTITKSANRLFPFILIVMIGVICYSSSFDASFNFDDLPSIVKNKTIKNLWDPIAIWNSSPTRFVAYLSFAVNYHFHGLTLFGYHFFNLLIHLSATLVLYWFIRLLFFTPELKDHPLNRYAKNIALTTSLLFVCHPVQTQAVTYIVQRITSMASFFYIFSLALFIKGRLNIIQGKPYLSFYVYSILATLLAMFTKEISVTLPICILVIEYFFFSPSPKKMFRGFACLWPMLLTLPVVPLTHILSRKAMIEHVGMLSETDTISRLDYLLTQINVLRSYLGLLFAPVNQSIDYNYPISRHLFEPSTLLSLLLLLFLLALAFILFRKFRPVSFGIAWFFLTLMVESSLIPIRDVIFEHRLYLPSAGIFLASSVLIIHLLGHRRTILFLLFTLIISILSLATINRNIIWKEQVLIWNDAAIKAPDKSRVYLNRGVGYSSLNKIDLAMRDYDLATKMDKNHPYPYFNRGFLLRLKGDYESAVSEFNMALRLQPDMAKAYVHRGMTYMAWKKYKPAYNDFYKAVKLDPLNPSFLNALGWACNKLNMYDLARLAFTRAIALNDKSAIPFINRGKTSSYIGKYKTAIKDFNRAAELSPGIQDTYYNRGLAYLALTRYKKAIRDFTTVITMNPESVKAYNNRGMAYQKLGKHGRALRDLNHAIKLNSNLEKLYRNRSKIYKSLGLEKKAEKRYYENGGSEKIK